MLFTFFVFNRAAIFVNFFSFDIDSLTFGSCSFLLPCMGLNTVQTNILSCCKKKKNPESFQAFLTPEPLELA